MSKREKLVITLIAICALAIGYRFAGSVNKTNHFVEIIPLTTFAEFEKRSQNQKRGQGDIFLTAQQWAWLPELTISSNRNYILHIATADIQHAFHLETGATGQSIDVLIQPGQEYLIKLQNLKPGVFAIGCTQYCGIEHNKMRGKLIVE
jgi:heme/copper-type cytochrome/quinol oxidase subunit 2